MRWNSRLRNRRSLAVLLVTLALVVFAGRAWQAAALESATWDEPYHLLSGYVGARLHDYRLDTEHPVLWKYWAALPNLFATPLRIDQDAFAWKTIPSLRGNAAAFTVATLFQTPGNDAEQLLQRGRGMMLVLALVLGALLARWSWRLGGPVAAVAAVVFYSLDPNVLAYAPLVGNDLPLALGLCAVAYATWCVGRQATLLNVTGLTLALCLALGTKYAALAFGPLAVLLLAVRALMDEPWTMFRRVVSTRSARLLRVAALGLLFAGALLLSLWASYGFRHDISPDPAVRMSLRSSVQLETKLRLIDEHPESLPTPAELEAAPTPPVAQALMAIDEHRLLPEAVVDGLLYLRAQVSRRQTFILGQLYLRGAWFYFPLAVLVKTPVGTLCAVIASLALLALLISGGPGRPVVSRARRWDLACLALPPLLYFGAAMMSSVNIGLRYVLPIYPFLFIGVGLAASRLLRMPSRAARWGVVALLLATTAESVAATPNYLSFFNVSAGGVRGGVRILGDSNIDWGQGLKALAAWQKAHPDEPLQLIYFGLARPEFYGIRASPLLTNDPEPEDVQLRDDGFVAISAHLVQKFGLELDRDPEAILAGGLFLYRAADLKQMFNERIDLPIADQRRE